MNKREETRSIKVGAILLGGGASISVQSMTNTDTRDVKSTVCQIEKLQEVGCDIIRVAVPDMEAALAVKEIKKNIKIPLVADIHFDYRLALKCLEGNVDKIRINPGNIGSIDRVQKVVNEAKTRNIPIRIGINGGSLEKSLLLKYGGVTPEAMFESAMSHIDILEAMDFGDIVVSLKASNVPMTIEAYKLMANKRNYPLHIGITEAGTLYGGIIKSSVGIGAILSYGIGDTIRVSLTGDPVEEIRAGKAILQAMELAERDIDFISCPTCGRCRINLIEIATQVESRLHELEKLGLLKKNLKVAVMGCAVNGPGEASQADIGIAGGDGDALLFKKGQIIRKLSGCNIAQQLIDEILLME